MSLVVWMPLNGDVSNQGVGKLNYISGNPVYANDGKLGKCLDLSVNPTLSFSCDELNGLDGSNVTIAFWVNVLTGDTGLGDWRRIVYLGDANSSGTSGSGFRFEACFNSSLRACSTHNNTTNNIWNASHLIIPNGMKNQWHHACVTMDGSSIKSYMDGVLVAESTSGKGTGHFNGVIQFGHGGAMRGKLNDFRIYDRALSLQEIKILSQCLLLHYPMTGGSRGCANLVPGQAKFTSVSPKVLTTTNTDGNSWLSGSAFEVKPSTTYTYSVCCDGQIATKHATDGSEPGTFSMWLYLCNDGTTKNWQGGAYDSPVCFTSSNYNHKQVGNRHIWQYTTTSTQRYMSIRLNNYGPGTVTNNYWGFKIEESPKFTPYLPNMNESEYNAMGYNNNTEYDVSGYLHNGTINGSVSYSNDTARYSVSSHFVSGSYIMSNDNCPTMLPTDAITVNIWVKPTTWGTPVSCTEGGGWNFEETGSGLQFQLYISSGVGYKPAKCSVTGASLQDGKWHMLTGTFNEVSQETKLYIDGQLKATTATGSPNGIGYANNRLIVSGEAQSTTPASAYFVGEESDLRIYATCLDQEDIQKLYNTSASIANNGVLMSYEFAET